MPIEQIAGEYQVSPKVFGEGHPIAVQVTPEGYLIVKSSSGPSAPEVVTTMSSTAGAETNVPAATGDTTILAANASRKRALVTNDSASATLYLLLASGTASATNYSVALPPGAVYEELVYTGVIKGVWSAAVGTARVTENT